MKSAPRWSKVQGGGQGSFGKVPKLVRFFLCSFHNKEKDKKTKKKKKKKKHRHTKKSNKKRQKDRAPTPSAGARKRGPSAPKVLVYI